MNVFDRVSSIITHFACFNTEVHTGLIHPRGGCKAEILFCSKPLFMYDNSEIFDHFKYLGSFISISVTDDRDIDARMLKAGNKFWSIQKLLLGSQYMHNSIKESVYESLILPILLYGAE